MPDQLQLITDGEKLIEDLKAAGCKSDSIGLFETDLVNFGNLCSSTKSDFKGDVFQSANKHLKEIKADCPKNADIVDKLLDMVASGQNIKCGGP